MLIKFLERACTEIAIGEPPFSHLRSLLHPQARSSHEHNCELGPPVLKPELEVKCQATGHGQYSQSCALLSVVVVRRHSNSVVLKRPGGSLRLRASVSGPPTGEISLHNAVSVE